jgi:ubiquinone/menaquinone biosynthesis C-methylase UbiE
MGFYSEKILPPFLDYAMRGDEIGALRARTLADARGRVLEVGFGTGLNARYYPRDIESLTVVDPNPGLSARAHERLAKANVKAEHLTIGGEQLPLGDASVDTVVVTFTLCSIPEVKRALHEMRRVLRPDGQLLFVEHNLSDDVKVARWQRRLTPLWRPFAGGCHLDRDAPQLLADAGFWVEVRERSQLPGTPATFGTIRRGVAGLC